MKETLAVAVSLGLFAAVGSAGLAQEPRTSSGLLSVADLYGQAARPDGLRMEAPQVDSSSMGFSTAGLGGLMASTALGQGGDDGPPGYLALKAGPVWWVGDVEGLDDPGVTVEVGYGFRLLRIFALEVFSGYYAGEDGGTTEIDLWGVPFGAKALIFLPIPLVKLYGGIGIAGHYVEAEIDAPGLSDDDDDWVFGGEVTLGARFEIASFMVGLEGKYFLTSEADLFGRDFALEAFSLMALLGVRF